MDRDCLLALNYLGVTIANTLSAGLTIEEINVLAQLFCVIGDALALIGAASE